MAAGSGGGHMREGSDHPASISFVGRVHGHVGSKTMENFVAYVGYFRLREVKKETKRGEEVS